MASSSSILKFTCMILSVCLSLGFSSANRFLFDQANYAHKNMDAFLHEPLKKTNDENLGVGYGVGSGSGNNMGYAIGNGNQLGTGIGYGIGKGGQSGNSVGYGIGYGSGGNNWYGPGFGVGSGIGIGSGSGGLGSGIGVGYGSGGAPECNQGNCNPSNGPGNCVPPHYEHEGRGKSANGAAKEMQKAISAVNQP